MINIFETQPDWLAEDDRQTRKVHIPSPDKPNDSLSYNINPEFMYDRHRVMLPPEKIAGKTILDLGSCRGATGAWCLENGAKHYTGVEKLLRYTIPSKKLFAKHFEPEQYEIVTADVEAFDTDNKYDIVIASGILYGILDSFNFLRRMARFSKDMVILDSVHPFNGYRRLFPDASDEDRYRVAKILSIIQPSERIRMTGALDPSITDEKEKAANTFSGGSVKMTASIVSLEAARILMKKNGFEYVPGLYELAEQEIDYYYDVRKHNRFMAEYRKVEQ